MKATELMIGDWVDINGLPVQVFELAYNHNEKEMTIGILDPQGEIYSAFYGYDHIEPIPITVEFLEKHGFEQINADYYDLDVYEANDGLWRVVYSNLECSGFDESVLVSSVLELQHFLRHLKIDIDMKEIEL